MENAPCEIEELGMVQNEEPLVDASKRDAKQPSAQVEGRVASREEMMEPLEHQIHGQSTTKTDQPYYYRSHQCFFRSEYGNSNRRGMRVHNYFYLLIS